MFVWCELLPWELLIHCKYFQLVLTGVLTIFAQEHGHEFNGDHALEELYDYIRKYQDQVNINTYGAKVVCRFGIVKQITNEGLLWESMWRGRSGTSKEIKWQIVQTMWCIFIFEELARKYLPNVNNFVMERSN